ncbi:hypothetical protein AB4084_16810, partial [Lysobacter sp. 2RAB21]
AAAEDAVASNRASASCFFIISLSLRFGIDVPVRGNGAHLNEKITPCRQNPDARHANARFAYKQSVATGSHRVRRIHKPSAQKKSPAMRGFLC